MNIHKFQLVLFFAVEVRTVMDIGQEIKTDFATDERFKFLAFSVPMASLY